jgi:protein SCO1/2
MNIKPVNLILFAVALAVFVYAFFFYDEAKPLRKLSVYGNKYLENNDTVFHTVPPFTFINQDSAAITEKSFDGSIYVADFFFTTCQSICPVMSTQMEKVAQAFKGNDNVKFLSHTVDPETDSVRQLKTYAIQHHADSKQWMFVTGDKKALYDIARAGYLLDAHEGDGGPDDFIHTQNFALIDKDKRIRGFYDGTNSEEVEQLIKDINLLLAEYKYSEK